MKVPFNQIFHPQAGSILAAALYAQLIGSPVEGASVQQLQGSHGEHISQALQDGQEGAQLSQEDRVISFFCPYVIVIKKSGRINKRIFLISFFPQISFIF